MWHSCLFEMEYLWDRKNPLTEGNMSNASSSSLTANAACSKKENLGQTVWMNFLEISKQMMFLVVMIDPDFS